MQSWWCKANERLIEFSTNHYNEWLNSKDGKRYKQSKKKNKSPYHFGFCLPDWVKEFQNALGENDEEKVKYLTHVYIIK